MHRAREPRDVFGLRRAIIKPRSDAAVFVCNKSPKFIFSARGITLFTHWGIPIEMSHALIDYVFFTATNNAPLHCVRPQIE
jgi:hypothetical protein